MTYGLLRCFTRPVVGVTEKVFDMKEIPLTQGKVALVDDVDYQWLMQWKWRARKQTKRNIWYAFRTRKEGGHKVSVLMHKTIVSGVNRVDHRDRDGLNNQRHNLRPATCTQNRANSRKTNRPVSSKFKGVFWHKRRRRWMATIKVMRKPNHLGSFHNEIDAAKAYDAAALKTFGEFACVNFQG